MRISPVWVRLHAWFYIHFYSLNITFECSHSFLKYLVFSFWKKWNLQRGIFLKFVWENPACCRISADFRGILINYLIPHGHPLTSKYNYMSVVWCRKKLWHNLCALSTVRNCKLWVKTSVHTTKCRKPNHTNQTTWLFGRILLFMSLRQRMILIKKMI